MIFFFLKIKSKRSENMNVTREELKQRVQAGIVLLDEKSPEWREFVDVKKFYIGNWRYCILGQLGKRELDGIERSDYGHYVCGMQHVDVDSRDAWKYGFELQEEEFLANEGDGVSELWQDLQSAWITELGK
jgi:hypothetical protein